MDGTMKTTQLQRTVCKTLCCLLPALLLAGCASKSGGTAAAPPRPAPLVNLPAKTPFRQYARVQLKGVEIDDTVKGGERAVVLARQLDEALLHTLGPLLGSVTAVPPGGDFPPAPEGTLQIAPRIEKAHLVSSAERDWLTWAAGDTEVIIRVSYREAKTGNVVAEPLFYRKAGWFAASMNDGTEDRQAREDIVRDIAAYTRANR
jgi:hypothetical protein